MALIQKHMNATPLATGSQGWRYKQELISELGFSIEWLTEPACIRAWVDGEERQLKGVELLPENGAFVTVMKVEKFRQGFCRMAKGKTIQQSQLIEISNESRIVVSGDDVESVWDKDFRETLFKRVVVDGIQFG
jgi:hypothetical protein